MNINTLEIRNYLLKPNMLEHFIDYFEAHFIAAQEAVKMYVLGQFRLIGEPNHFVWLRGFSDMQTRLEGLQSFYTSELWLRHRNVTNGMILDNDDVHLLRPVGSMNLTCGASAESVDVEFEAGTISTDTGVIAIDFYQARPDKRDALIEAFQTQIAPAYEQQAIQIRGTFVAEMSENTYPRLPVIQIADEFVVITAYESEAVCREKREKLAHHIEQTIAPLLSRASQALLLSPTLRSPLRYGSQ